jgi:hypothetical protein
LRGVDVTEIFKEKGHGDRLRWSAKRTVGGVIVATACRQIELHGITVEAIILTGIGVLPLLFSVLERGEN